jgi:hypothetical protein
LWDTFKSYPTTAIAVRRSHLTKYREGVPEKRASVNVRKAACGRVGGAGKDILGAGGTLWTGRKQEC